MKLIITDHFVEIKNQIYFRTENLLCDKNLCEADYKMLNDIRQRQLETLEQVVRRNLLSVKLNESKWMNAFQNETLTYKENLEIIKKSLIVNDCVLMKNESYKSGKLFLVSTAKKI